MQKTQKTFSCRRKFHPTPGTLSNHLSVTWETRRENWNLPGPVNYATQNGRPCPRTGIFFCKATSAQDRNLQPPKALNKDRTPPKHALARAVEYTALGTGVRAEARPIAHFFHPNHHNFVTYEPFLKKIQTKSNPNIRLESIPGACRGCSGPARRSF